MLPLVAGCELLRWCPPSEFTSPDVATSLGVLAEERNQRLEIDAAAPVTTTVDRLMLREAVTNVVDNAIKYGPKGSRVVNGVKSRRQPTAAGSGLSHRAAASCVKRFSAR